MSNLSTTEIYVVSYMNNDKIDYHHYSRFARKLQPFGEDELRKLYI
ncbi:MAG: hypothetical protein M1481_03265 [Candidatus Thermoplasmatota archaeon]|nr:hypothetical protein [Candidatus Thermoplasmatota archaeon]MCL5963770.1 hypothetical protein [Candidatus Thermoplasmatota archaeon]